MGQATHGMSRRSRRLGALTAVAATAALALLAAGCGGSGGSESTAAPAASTQAPAAVQKVRLAVIPGGGLALYPQIVAADKQGFYRQNNVRVVRTDTGTSGDAAQLLITGNADVATITPDVAAKAIAQGAKLVVVASTAEESPYYLVSRDELGGASAFKGKKLGVPQTTGTATFISKAALAKEGVAPTDYELIVTGKASQRLAALSHGAVDATVLPAPLNLKAESEGFHELMYAGDAVDAPGAVLVATRTFAKQHRAALVGFLTAFLQAGQWLSDADNRDAFLGEVSADAMGQGITKDQLRTTYDEFIVRRAILPEVGRVDLTGLLAAMKKYGELDQIPKLGAGVDNAYVDEAAAAAGLSG